jgi:hypothetical protein
LIIFKHPKTWKESNPNEKDLIQSKESYIATGFIDPGLTKTSLTLRSQNQGQNWRTACAGVA